MKRILFALIVLCFANVANAASQLEMGIDRSVTPSVVCTYYTSTNCLPIGTMSAGGQYNLPSGVGIGAISGNLSSTLDIVTKTTTTCGPDDGHRPTDGTQSWVLTCFGVWSAADPNAFTIFPTRGTSGGGTPSSLQTTGFLVQSWADGNQATNYNAVGINFQTIGGSVSNVPGAQDNAVSLFDSIRQAPGPAGQTAVPTWGLNIDFHIAPNAGNTQTWLQELDLNNFNKDCGVGTGCISAWIWFNGINPWPNLAMLYGGSANATQHFGGLATTNGNTITVTSFTDNTALNPALTFATIGGVDYKATFVDATHATTAVALPTNTTPVAFDAWTAMSHFGFFLNSLNQVLEADLRFGDAATWGMQLDGHHIVGIDTASDTLTQAMSMKTGQTVCWNNGDVCLEHVSPSNVFQFLTAGNVPFYITLNDNVVHTKNLQVDGTGILQFGTFVATVCTNSGSVNIKDTSGNVRKVMICS